MKNLHKKIGAMFLAGMVVFGGVAVSGVNSFAASNANLSIEQVQQKNLKLKKVNFYLKRADVNIEAIEVKNNRQEIDQIIKDKYSDKKCYKKRNVPQFRDKIELASNLKPLKQRGIYELCIVKLNHDYYLIKLK